MTHGGFFWLAWLLFTLPSFSAQTGAAPHGSGAYAGFEVASFRLSDPGERFTRFSTPDDLTFTAKNVSLKGLIGIAFGVQDEQILGLQGWAESKKFDVAAKPSGDKPLNEKETQQALQRLLQERVHLTVHHETKSFEGYRLVIAKGGPKLRPGNGAWGRIYLSSSGLTAPNTTLERFATALHFQTGGYPVVDATGIKGEFNIQLKFAPEGDHNSSLPSVFTALQEQLGLKLVRARVSLDTIVVDRVDEVPVEN